MQEYFQKDYHLTSNGSPRLEWTILFLGFPVHIRELINEDKDFQNALNLLEFLSEPICNNLRPDDRSLPIIKSTCLQGLDQFDEARKILEHEIYLLYDGAFHMGGWIYYDRQGKDAEAVYAKDGEYLATLLRELYDLGRIEDRKLIVRGLEEIIERESRAEDMPRLQGIGDPSYEQLRIFRQFRFEDPRLNQYIEDCAREYQNIRARVFWLNAGTCWRVFRRK